MAVGSDRILAAPGSCSDTYSYPPNLDVLSVSGCTACTCFRYVPSHPFDYALFSFLFSAGAATIQCPTNALTSSGAAITLTINGRKLGAYGGFVQVGSVFELRSARISKLSMFVFACRCECFVLECNLLASSINSVSHPLGLQIDTFDCINVAHQSGNETERLYCLLPQGVGAKLSVLVTQGSPLMFSDRFLWLSVEC